MLGWLTALAFAEPLTGPPGCTDLRYWVHGVRAGRTVAFEGRVRFVDHRWVPLGAGLSSRFSAVGAAGDAVRRDDGVLEVVLTQGPATERHAIVLDDRGLPLRETVEITRTVDVPAGCVDRSLEVHTAWLVYEQIAAVPCADVSGRHRR